VYHGKFFLGLMATRPEARNHYAIDAFALQKFNLDGAGVGNRGVFLRNLHKCGFDPEIVNILEMDSLSINDVLIDKIITQVGGFSLFSVDGCHRIEHTINDALTAMRLTLPTGVIFMDDYTNPDWPGVQEGLTKLYLTSAPRFVPLALAHNKLLLAHLSYHRELLNSIIDRMKIMGNRTKLVTRHGYDCVNVQLDLNDRRYIYSP